MSTTSSAALLFSVIMQTSGTVDRERHRANVCARISVRLGSHERRQERRPLALLQPEIVDQPHRGVHARKGDAPTTSSVGWAAELHPSAHMSLDAIRPEVVMITGASAGV